ncbi:lymphocyte antigen 6H-like [Prionailurus bengalensis]|uniref:lymphocyte antigen 6H-like n=1 Tax=Prionailurus bengalensis TaxID=37029 RepID=UPI001CA82568|nr:lymphocyte antigen 6H-like [Prionailurus bengalensis]
MRGLQLVLLVFLLCWERVLSLQCYSCLELEAKSQCQPIQCPMSGVCFNSDMTATLGTGKKVKSQHKGCAPSCEVATKIMTQLSQMTNPESLSQGVLTKFEVQEVTCCEKDLCNRVARTARSSWALAGGLLLSLGPAFLRALP